MKYRAVMEMKHKRHGSIDGKCDCMYINNAFISSYLVLASGELHVLMATRQHAIWDRRKSRHKVTSVRGNQSEAMLWYSNVCSWER